jgi:hypothetical protein
LTEGGSYCQQYDQPQQYEPLLCQTSDISGQEYNQPQQYEPLLCQTSNSNGQQYKQPQQYETLHIIDNYYFRFDRGVVHIVVAGDIVDHYCLMFDRGVVHIVVAVILTITV